jgi:hypothetical protein
VTPPETTGDPSTSSASGVGQPPSVGEPHRLTGSAALRLHLTLAAGLTVCIGAFSFEVIRALGGNTLSWLYVFEWPFFAGFSIYMWWKLLNESYGGPTRSGPTRSGPTRSGGGPKASAGVSSAAAEEHDEALRAWNQYLAEMSDAEKQDQDRAY